MIACLRRTAVRQGAGSHALLPVVAQLGLAAVAIVVLTLAPPASGRMLLVPVDPAMGRTLPALAVASGAALVGAGRWRGSMIVDARLDRVLGIMTRHAVLVLAVGPDGACDGNRGLR